MRSLCLLWVLVFGIDACLLTTPISLVKIQKRLRTFCTNPPNALVRPLRVHFRRALLLPLNTEEQEVVGTIART